MHALDAKLANRLDKRRDQHLYRHRVTTETPCGPELVVEGQRFLAFCSNDYLGLANHPAINRAAISALDKYGFGSGASHLISGHSRLHEKLENRLAQFTGRPRALVFSTGYMANLGVISALTGRNDLIVEDQLSHASLIDGGLLSRAEFRRYNHTDPDDLERILGSTERQTRLVVTDGVFSMDGDCAPLTQLVPVCESHRAVLMVDDAHGFGVLGNTGGGLVQESGLSVADVPILIGTLGKAFGTFGAFVAGSEELIESLIQFARTYIYTTAIPPLVAAATLASLDLVENESWRREKLAALIKQFRAGAQQIGLRLTASQTPIQPVLVGEDAALLAVDKHLKSLGIMAGAIRSPTVPQGSARLRLTLSAAHEPNQVDQLLAALDTAFREAA